MEKLRSRIKEQDEELAAKAAEVGRLKQRLAAVEQENTKLKTEKNRRKELQQQQNQVAAPQEDELRRLRSDLVLVEAERDQLKRTVEDYRTDAALRRDDERSSRNSGKGGGGNGRREEEERIRQLEEVVSRLQERLEASMTGSLGFPVSAPPVEAVSSRTSPRRDEPTSTREREDRVGEKGISCQSAAE
jgi:chromosome segregation ATPase